MTTAPVTQNNVFLLAPIRQSRGRTVPPRPDIPRPTSAQITEAMTMVAATGWIATFGPRMPYAMRIARGEHLGGRKPEMTLDALLVGCLLLAMMERPLIIRDVHRLLDQGIDAATRKYLGLDPKRAITERMVSRLFNNLAATLNPSLYAESNAWLFEKDKVRDYLKLDEDVELDPYEHAYFIDSVIQTNTQRLDEFIRIGLRATHPTDSEHGGDFSIDGTYMPSWEKSRSSRRRTTYKNNVGARVKRPARPHEMADPDATWWSKKNDGPIGRRSRYAGSSNVGLGYLMSVVTWAEKDFGPGTRGPDIPNLIEHFSLKTARTVEHREGSNLIDCMVAHHDAEDDAAGRPHRWRGDILSDRGYSRAAAWQRRMHEAGFTPHFALAAEQRGLKDPLGSGVLVIDGIPYSPGIPLHLRKKMAPPVFATRNDRATGAAYFMQRKPYRISANRNRRDADGSIKAYCPASNQAKARINCANKPESAAGKEDRIEIGSQLPIIGITNMPAICTQTTVTITFDELPFWQPHIPGTAEHQWSINRRNLVESAFSRIKDEATQSLRRGQVRLMGRAKMSMGALFFAMAANMVDVARWRLRQAGIYSLDAAREIASRTPRRHTRARIKSVARRGEAKRQRAALSLLEELGMPVDLIAGELLPGQDPPPTV